MAVRSHQPFAVGFSSPTQAEPRPGSGSAPGNSQHLPPNFLWVPGTPSHPTQHAHPARSVQGSQAVSGQPPSCSPPSFCSGSPDPAPPWPRGHPPRACLWMAVPTGPAQSSGHKAWRVDAEGSSLVRELSPHKAQCLLPAKSLQSCPTLCSLMHCSPSGSSVHGTVQARILEWVASSFSRGASQTTQHSQEQQQQEKKFLRKHIRCMWPPASV